MAKDRCYYDGQCGLCQRTARLLRRLDWLGRLEFEDMLTAGDLPVAPEAALRGMPMRTADGRVLVGFEAVLRAMRQTPAGLVPAMVMGLPGVRGFARWAYDRIAANRARSCRV